VISKDAKAVALLALVVLATGLPFVRRAYFVDDYYFVTMAKGILQHPWRPYDFKSDDAGIGNVAWERGQRPRMVNPPVFHYFLAGVRHLRNGFFERVKVHHYEIDQLDLVLHRLRKMVGLVAARQEAAMNFRVQRLHAALHDFGEACVLAHLGDGQAFFGEELRGATGRNQFVTETLDKGGREFDEAAFIAHGEEG